MSVATDAAAMRTGLWCARNASWLQTTTAAAPSHTGAASKIPMGEATSAERPNCSALIGSRNIALPLVAALAWATTAKGAKASRGAPVSCM